MFATINILDVGRDGAKTYHKYAECPT